MIELSAFPAFLVTALLIAVTPGPGILYVAARTLAGGRREGLASSFGTGLGGFVHVAAGAIGLSALLMASAEAFTLLKIIGAAYLLWLGVKTIREAKVDAVNPPVGRGTRRAFREGVVVEALNPKTAAFFLAFIPQFIDPAQSIGTQFVLLGAISVGLNTAVDVVVAFIAARARAGMEQRPGLVRKLRLGSGLMMCGLGTTLLYARRAN